MQNFSPVFGRRLIARIYTRKGEPSLLTGVSTAVTAVFVALIVQLLFHDFFVGLPFFLFYPAVTLAAWYGGMLAGLVSAVLSVIVVNYFFLPPLNGFSLSPLDVAVGTGFACFAVFFASLRQREFQVQRLFEQQHEELQVTFNSIGDGVITTDVNGRVTFLNPVAAQLTGWTNKDAKGLEIEQVFRIVSEVTRIPEVPPARKALEQGRVVGLAADAILITRDGSEKRVSDSGAPIYGRDGKLLGAVMVFRDITSQREAERALEASERRYRTLVESATDVIYTLDMDGNLTSINAAGEQLLGYPQEALLNKPIVAYVVPESLGRMKQMLERKIQGQEQTVYEVDLITRNGSKPTIEVHSQFIKADGQPIGIFGIARDITQRKQAEKRNLILQEFAVALSGAVTLEQVTEVVIQMIVQMDSAAVSAVFRLSDDGKQLERLGSTRITSLQRPTLPMNGDFPIVEAVRSRQVLWFETRDAYRRRYPQLENTDIQAALCLPFFGRNGVSGGMYIAYTESVSLTQEERNFLFSIAQICGQAIERASLFEAEAAARQRAEEADRLKLQFLGMVSHELRTPLTSIKGFASTLVADDIELPPEQQRQFAKIMDEEADKLTLLVEELLDLSSLTAGRLEIAPVPQPLHTIVETARLELSIAVRDHVLSLDVSPHLPPVLADTRRIAQVLTNLVGNAVKHSPPGSTIHVHADQNGDTVQVVVDDEGSGIPPEARELMFETFRRGDRHKKGAGLGLAICKGLVEAHGGRIWIADKPTPGTRIAFTLPLAKEGL
jgi:PAS domain S-box-containing protein